MVVKEDPVLLLELCDFLPSARLRVSFDQQLLRGFLDALRGRGNVGVVPHLVDLVQLGLALCELVQVAQVRIGLLLGVLERRLLALDELDAVRLLEALLVQPVDLLLRFGDRLLVLSGARGPKHQDRRLPVLF